MLNTFKYRALETTDAVLLKSSSGVLHSVILSETSATPVVIWDSTGSGGNKIATLKASIAEGDYIFDCRFAKGLYIENPGASKLTVTYA